MTLTVPEAARRVGRDPSTVRRWIRQGRLKATKSGAHQVVEAEDLDALLDVVELPGEGDEGEVHGVEHELDAHEHHEGVATDEQADRTGGEHDGAEREVGLGAERSERHDAASSDSGVSASSPGRSASTIASRR